MQIPQQWDRLPAWVLFTRQRRPSAAAEGIVTAFRDGQVTLRSRRREEGFTNAVQEIGYQGVRRGDLVIHSMDGFAGAIGVSDSDGKASPVVHAYKAVEDVDARFYAYLLRDLARSGFITSLAKGIRERSTAFDPATFRSLVLPRPPLEEQRAIANLLDRETARIDSLIDRKSKLASLLRTRRAASIRAAFRATEAPLVQLKRITRVKRGQSPRPIDNPAYFDEEGSHGWVRIEDVTRQGMYLRFTRQRLSALGRRKSVAVAPGMVLISIAATVGKPVITAMNCCYHDGFVGLHELRAVPEYVYYWLSLPEAFAGLEQTGTQSNINSEIVGRVAIPLPSTKEQQRVVDELASTLGTLDALSGRLGAQVRLLQERRQRLVTSAVTGQLDIPETA